MTPELIQQKKDLEQESRDLVHMITDFWVKRRAFDIEYNAALEADDAAKREKITKALKEMEKMR